MARRDRVRDGALRLLRTPAVRAHADRGSVRLSGLTDRAMVRRDDRGVPWIIAHDERDLYFASGFAQASDRLWQMDVLRRRARGRLAEVLGETVVPEDVRARRLALERVARQSLELVDRASYACLVAFSDGVNAAIRRLRRRAGLPVEFLLLRYRPEPWTPLDSVLIVKHLGFDLGTNLRQEVFRMRLAAERPRYAASFSAPRYPIDGAVTIRRPGQGVDMRLGRPGASESAPVVELPEQSRAWLRGLLDGETSPGSNAWAVSGRLTRSGAPLLANDPHVLFTQPSIWYQMGLLLSAEPATAYGITVPGLPGLIAGSNSRLAWGITNATVDTQDLCLLDGPAARPTWRQESVISVRGGADVAVRAAGGQRHVEFDAPGPDGAARLGLFWSGFVPSTEIVGCLRMWRAETYPRFRAALRDFGVPVLNVVVATADDVIALKTAGNVPRRRPGSGLAPASFGDVAESWQDLLSFDELPETVNPAEGYIISANHKLVPDDAKVHVGVDWVAPYRAERIEQLIRDGSISAEECARWQNDLADGRAARVLPVLLDALAARPPTDPLAGTGHRLLSEWDGHARGEQPAPLVFLRLLQALVDRWVTEPLGADLATSMPDLTLQVDHLILDAEARRQLGETEPLPVVVAEALETAIARIVTAHGTDPAGWRYDAVHRVNDRHPIAKALPGLRGLFGGDETPVGGSGHSVCLMTPDRSGAAIEGAPWRFVAEVDPAGPLLRDVLRHGSSGLPGSAHYDDQTPVHAQGQTYLVPLAGPQGAADRTLTLLPSRPATG
ncbi:penicillin acylase family protein [Verrucosispora sp. WMMD703]|uniref:penicillin acylase family protein n=1 Tax=Verrucosispora sp. WMMD703 TaxID=3403463 RepID=UPI003B9627F7